MTTRIYIYVIIPAVGMSRGNIINKGEMKNTKDTGNNSAKGAGNDKGSGNNTATDPVNNKENGNKSSGDEGRGGGEFHLSCDLPCRAQCLRVVCKRYVHAVFAVDDALVRLLGVDGAARSYDGYDRTGSRTDPVGSG